jgi:hypothetical protein
MEFYSGLLLGPGIERRRKEVLRKLKHGKALHNVFLITLPSNDRNLLDILPANLLLQPYYKKQKLFVLGIGKGRDEVLELLRFFIEQIYTDTGELQVADYIAGEKECCT